MVEASAVESPVADAAAVAAGRVGSGLIASAAVARLLAAAGVAEAGAAGASCADGGGTAEEVDSSISIAAATEGATSADAAVEGAEGWEAAAAEEAAELEAAAACAVEVVALGVDAAVADADEVTLRLAFLSGCILRASAGTLVGGGGGGTRISFSASIAMSICALAAAWCSDTSADSSWRLSSTFLLRPELAADWSPAEEGGRSGV